ncbi:SRPBCC domain-containing protein [Ciceribacter sp. L1K23]|uniref:SRPBCC domain-containing protein n=1 Tax=Ciceribacter sp. L1K23 TaxID=2820276 RepID=UPI001B8241B4|nr:SRPBCC domain-containing protein [Ciceribacter sp. L1K23]MBR0554612.1 SRPBCC domain-containing protein [Ciceribacter sp. L1K23]
MTPAAQEHRTITVERIYPNCVDHVWAAWSIAEKKRAWFGEGLKDFDFREGGVERSGFDTDMGTHANETRYFEISAKTRIVFAYSMALNGRIHTVSLATVLFADHGGGTKLTYVEQLCVIPPSDGAEGREHGWRALLESLAAYLAEDTRAKKG